MEASDNQIQSEWGHQTVLLQEALDGLTIQPGDIFLDATLGSGGHTHEVLQRFGSEVTVIGLDADADALGRSEKRLKDFLSNKAGSKVTLVQENFRNLDRVLDGLTIPQVNKILFDLGFSSNQLEESKRGFSFQKDEPLQMTFKKEPGPDEVTAYMIVNEWSEETLSTILWGYGDERYARRIASQIVQAREQNPIKTTFELVNIILEATPRAYHHRRINPATKTFQALRIAANDELTALGEALDKAFSRLLPDGRMAVISFHSLEDRIVKNFFRDKAKEGLATLITKKPITSQPSELESNRRARSAKLRIISKV